MNPRALKRDATAGLAKSVGGSFDLLIAGSHEAPVEQQIDDRASPRAHAPNSASIGAMSPVRAGEIGR